MFIPTHKYHTPYAHALRYSILAQSSRSKCTFYANIKRETHMRWGYASYTYPEVYINIYIYNVRANQIKDADHSSYSANRVIFMSASEFVAVLWRVWRPHITNLDRMLVSISLCIKHYLSYKFEIFLCVCVCFAWCCCRCGCWKFHLILVLFNWHANFLFYTYII